MQTKANSPLEMFEQFEQSDDLRLCTKGGDARGGTNRMWWTSIEPRAKLSDSEYMADDRNEVTQDKTERGKGGFLWILQKEC